MVLAGDSGIVRKEMKALNDITLQRYWAYAYTKLFYKLHGFDEREISLRPGERFLNNCKII